MADIFKIGDNDYSDFVVAGGVVCNRDERCVVKNTTLDGTIHKHRAVAKDKVGITLAMVPDAVYTALVADVSAIQFTATYRAQTGVVTKACATDTGAVGTLLQELDGGVYWGTVALTIYEV